MITRKLEVLNFPLSSVVALLGIVGTQGAAQKDLKAPSIQNKRETCSFSIGVKNLFLKDSYFFGYVLLLATKGFVYRSSPVLFVSPRVGWVQRKVLE